MAHLVTGNSIAHIVVKSGQQPLPGKSAGADSIGYGRRTNFPDVNRRLGLSETELLVQCHILFGSPASEDHGKINQWMFRKYNGGKLTAACVENANLADGSKTALQRAV